MDAAEEVDDRRAGRRRLGDALAEDHVGQQQAQTGAGVGLEQEQDRLAVLGDLVMPSGVSTPWLMALLRKSTFAGSMRIEVSGQQVVVDQEVDRRRRARR